ncbi:latrophilin Cirl-like isoform X2 [Agrilus planipennis]|uniref:Latrophilin Cirl-like isoform X2 n=1 Tax=Agrilus planipennis TaxID=224129 RepID=A0A7F5R605_AGRPL|nr:latrophilin Cirl-like isoform X2 [Agrilus planipennis]
MAVVGMAWHGLLLLLYGFCISGTMPKGLELIRYETAYACEGKTLKIECRSGESIKLIRANYGRFSITICNDHGNTDWSVNCMSPKTLRVLHNRCNLQSNCTVQVNNIFFEGDPCPNTIKYVEAQYYCASTTTTTNRPSPPWLITSQPPVWSTVKPTARPPPPPPKVSVTNPPKSHTTLSTTVEVNSSSLSQAPDIINEENSSTKSKTVHPPEQQSEGVTVSFTTLSPKSSSIVNNIPNEYMPSPSVFTPNLKEIDRYNYCSPVTLRSIFWNWTRIGDVSIQPCPGGTTGFARWRCKIIGSEPTWLPLTPDLSECRSVWLTSLEQRVLAGRDPLTSITSDLAQVTSSKTLYGGDMMITTKIIQNMAQKMSVDIQTFPDHRQREAIVTEMLSDVVRTGSNLLDSTQHPSWRDLSYQEQMRVATSLLIGLEENAFLLADTVIREKTVDQVAKNIMLSVRVLETKNIRSEKFPSDNRWAASNDTIEIPQGALLENSEGGFVRLVFVAFDRLEEILQWLPDHGESNSNKNQTKILNSKIISASLGKGRHIQLHYLVRLTLMHIQVHNVTDPVCVFWDYTTSTWSEEGCHIESTNFTHTICLCDHLTNFAILANVQPTYYPVGQQMALQIITYIGCIIAIICLAITLLTFHLFRGIKSDRTTIYFNICVCLLVVELLFVIGVGQTDSELACRIIAAFLHYFILCTFIWMFFEGFHLYIMLIEVFESQKSRLCLYYLIAYILSLLIVSITGAIFPNGYGTSNYCWLRMDGYFIYTFAGPIIIIVVLNLIFLSMAIIMMCQHASASVSMKNKEHSKLRSIRSWLQGVVILVFLVSLTWVFGFLYLNRDSIIITYLFASLNSLQGIFILLFHCIQNEKVRKEYRKLIRRHSWLPKCLRCSKPSGGSGGGSENSPSVGKDHRPGVYVGSNGNPVSNSHSMDNSVLSPHGSSLSRGWNSRSCNNMNRVGKFPALASTSANVAAALCPSSRAGATTPPPIFEPPNTSTLPYIRNFYKCSTQNPNLPKSTSTWGPLNKHLQWKSISFKSCSRDSGHGGSEQENSPRSHTAVADIRLNNTKEVCRQTFIPNDFEHGISNNSQNEELVKLSQHGERVTLPKQNQIPNTLQPVGLRKKNGTFLRATSPWNHTYTEIHDCRLQRGGLMPEDDPVYEEIEKNEMQVSDMSDEDGKRQSDMSRQSSRSYGDHRPLIPYSPANDRSIHSCFQEEMSKHRSKDHTRYATDVDHYRTRGHSLHKGDTVRSLAAVLDGETVVCHLEPPESYQYDPFVSRTLVLPQYSES